MESTNRELHGSPERLEPFSADVGQAFLRGLSFEQIQEMDGEVHRDVQFTVPPGSVPILQTLTNTHKRIMNEKNYEKRLSEKKAT